MKKLATIVVLGATALLTAVGPALTASASVPVGYMSAPRGTATVTYVEFTVSRSRVVGALTTTTVTNANPNAYLASSTTQFTGTDSDGHLTLYLAFASAPEFGSVNGSSLSMQVPQSNGQLNTVTFIRTSVAAYNAYIARWQTAITDANVAVAQAQAASAARAAHQQQLLNRLNATINTVDSDLSAIQSPGTLGDDENTLSDDVTTVGDDVTTVEDDMSTVRDDLSSNESPCGDISAAYNDAADTNHDAKVIVTDARQGSGVAGDLRDERRAMASTPGDYATYWQAQHALPTYHPTNPIPPLKVALATGQSVINGAVSQVNSYINQANGYVAQAYRLVNAAQKANHCGPTRNAPVIGHITAGSLAG